MYRELFWYLNDVTYETGDMKISCIRDCKECIAQITDEVIKAKCNAILTRTIRQNVFQHEDRFYLNKLMD